MTMPSTGTNQLPECWPKVFSLLAASYSSHTFLANAMGQPLYAANNRLDYYIILRKCLSIIKFASGVKSPFYCIKSLLYEARCGTMLSKRYFTMVMTKFGFILAETTGETPAETPDMMVRIQEFIKSPYFYAALAVLVILVLIALSSSSNRKKVIKQNEDNQFRLNNLKSVPLPFDISRAMAMARVNKEIDATVKENQGKFDLVQTNLKTLQGMIADSDEYVQLRKYGMARDNNNRIDKLLTETEKTVEDLENSLSTILEQENVQREKINDLKEVYHNIKLKINQHSDQYLFCIFIAERQFITMDHIFCRISQWRIFDQRDLRFRDHAHIKKMLAQRTCATHFFNDRTLGYFQIS